ncbi:hypothetical protein MAR_019792, partial [Mya arenaria]
MSQTRVMQKVIIATLLDTDQPKRAHPAGSGREDATTTKCGDWNLDITCNLVDEGVVIYKNGIVVTDSGGTCVAPNTCENCNEGFYPNSEVGKCKATGDYPMDLVEMEFEFHECSNELCPHIIVSGSKSWSNAKERVSIAIKTLAEDSFELPDPPEYIFTDTEIGLDSIAVSVTAKRVLLNVRIKNGGYVSYQKIDERNFSPSKGRYTINGVEKSYDKELEIDMIAPYHCKENNPTCSSQPLRTSTDFVTGNQIALYWDGWSDDNSGISEYTIHLYMIKKAGSNTLKQDHGTTGESITTYSSARSATLNLEHPGPYAVELTAMDHAGNTKTARRLFFFDNISEVSLNTSSSTMVSNANENGWITQNTDSIDVAWAYRFQNIRHDNNCWLCRFE